MRSFVFLVLASAMTASCTLAFSTSFPSPLSLSRRVVKTPTAATTSRPPHTSPFKMSIDAGSGDDEAEFIVKVKVDPLVKETSLLLRRLSWLAWWSQLILTTVSAFTLLFARNVIGTTSAANSIAQSASLPNFVLAGLGIGLSFGSIFWTWATRRLARRLLKKPTSRIQTANMLRKSITIGVTLNLIGMAVSLLSAEQIVGVLAIKVLTTTSRAVTLLESSTSMLQPLDILVVQANTNTLFSHFSSLCALLWMTKSVSKLDPPSTEGKKNDSQRR